MPPKTRLARLCGHIKHDGSICRSPALRRRRYCYWHIELRRRQRRAEHYRQNARLKRDEQEARKNYVLMADLIVKSPSLKKMVLKFFDQNTLRDVYGLNPDGSRSCEKT